MRLVELWGVSNFFGLIVLEKTGVEYSNQTGGVSCSHPTVEGFYVPLPVDFLSKDTARDCLTDVYGGTDARDSALAAQWLDEQGLSSYFEYAPEARQSVMEAWIPVRVKPLPEKLAHRNCFGAVVLEKLIGRIGVLTYENSD